MHQNLQKNHVYKHLILIVFLSVLVQSCDSKESFRQSLNIESDIKLIDVYIFIGEEKSWWSTINKNDNKTVVLYPDINGELSIIYNKNGEKIYSNGPLINISKSNNIYIYIREKGIQYEIK